MTMRSWVGRQGGWYRSPGIPQLAPAWPIVIRDTGCGYSSDYYFPLPPFPVPPGPQWQPPQNGGPQWQPPQNGGPPPAVPQDQPPQPAVPQQSPGPKSTPNPNGRVPRRRFVRRPQPQTASAPAAPAARVAARRIKAPASPVYGTFLGNQDFWTVKNAFSPGYPWPEPTLHEQNYPTPGMFFDANNTQGSFVFTNVAAFVRAALGSALAMAGADVQLAVDQGATGKRLRKQMLDLIVCSRWNDELYGTSDPVMAGGAKDKTYMMGPQGRGLNVHPVEDDNLVRLSKGNSAMRTTAVDGKRLNAHMGAVAMPLIWIPAVNLTILKNDLRVTVEGMQWGDNVSMREPPEQVRALGVNMSGVVLPGGAGCTPSQWAAANPDRMRRVSTGQRAENVWGQRLPVTRKTRQVARPTATAPSPDQPMFSLKLAKGVDIRGACGAANMKPCGQIDHGDYLEVICCPTGGGGGGGMSLLSSEIHFP